MTLRSGGAVGGDLPELLEDLVLGPGVQRGGRLVVQAGAAGADTDHPLLL